MDLSNIIDTVVNADSELRQEETQINTHQAYGKHHNMLLLSEIRSESQDRDVLCDMKTHNIISNMTNLDFPSLMVSSNEDKSDGLLSINQTSINDILVHQNFHLQPKGQNLSTDIVTKDHVENGISGEIANADNYPESVQVFNETVTDKLLCQSQLFNNDTKESLIIPTSICNGSSTNGVSGNSKASSRTKKTRRRYPNPCPQPLPVILPPCRVCDEKASGYHYGANTCEACKGFFRRTLTKTSVLFPCKCTTFEKDAWKGGPVRNGCPSCRYDRCLAVGMARNAIKIGRYSLMRRTENIREVKHLEILDDIVRDAVHGESSILGNGLKRSYPEEIPSTLMITTPNEFTTESILQPPVKRQKMIVANEDKTIPDELCLEPDFTLEEIISTVNILVDAKNKIWCSDMKKKEERIASIQRRQNDCYERYQLKTALFGEMTPLSRKDFFEFYEATGIYLDDRFEDLKCAMEFLEGKIHKIVEFAKSIPGFKNLHLDDQASLIKVSRVESTFIGGYRRHLRRINMDLQVTATPWGKEYHFNEITKIFPKELIILRHKLALEIRSLELTTEEEVLMRAIAITSADRCELESPQAVQNINLKLLECLQYVLSTRQGGAGNKLHKVFDILTKLRELTELDNKVSREIFLDWPALSNYHLISEFFK